MNMKEPSMKEPSMKEPRFLQATSSYYKKLSSCKKFTYHENINIFLYFIIFFIFFYLFYIFLYIRNKTYIY